MGLPNGDSQRSPGLVQILGSTRFHPLERGRRKPCRVERISHLHPGCKGESSSYYLDGSRFRRKTVRGEEVGC